MMVGLYKVYWNNFNRLEEVEKANLLLSKNYGNNHHLNEELEALKRENSSLEKILQECLARLKSTFSFKISPL